MPRTNNKGARDVRISPRVRKKPAPGPRTAHFAVLARISKAGQTAPGRLSINRKTRLATVRAHRSRTTWTLTLDQLAELLVSRAAKLEAERRLGTGER